MGHLKIQAAGPPAPGLQETDKWSQIGRRNTTRILRVKARLRLRTRHLDHVENTGHLRHIERPSKYDW